MNTDFFNLSKPQKSKVPEIMGILNVTPDSFSDGGQFSTVDDAIEHAKIMIEQGADIIDIGGESTRPGAGKVNLDEEASRVIPVIERIRSFSEVKISIDTSKAELMRQAVSAGATMVNDIFALQKGDAQSVCGGLNVPVCLMHMQGDPESMQKNPKYDDVMDEIKTFLRHRIFDCQSSGIKLEDIYIDPGFGFGKTVEQNFLILKNLADFKSLGAKILVGISRKSMLGDITHTSVDQRLAASLSAAIISAMNGADILRVHDVLETKQALQILEQVI